MSAPIDAPTKVKRRRAEPIGMRVVQYNDGIAKMAPGKMIALVPASASDEDRVKPHLRGGDLVFIDFRKPRVLGFHRLAHALGKMVVENVDDFSHLTPHEALKRLQMEAGAGCELVLVDINTVWPGVIAWIKENMGEAWATVLTTGLRGMGVKNRKIPVAVPRSLSYESMDQMYFHDTVKAICKYIAKRYWTSMSPEEIEQMAEAAGKMLE